MALRFEKIMGKLKPETIKKVEELKDTPAHNFARLAVTLATIRKKTTDKLHNSIRKEGGIMSEDTPLALPIIGNPQEVVVFPNIKAKGSMESVVDYLRAILSDPKTKLRVETRERALKLVLKREHTTLARLITEHSDLVAKGYRADQIEAISKKTALLFAKPRFVICKTPAECYIAYSTNVIGSCMKKGSTHYQDWTSKTWVKIADDTGHYPSSWYLYLPYAKQCYLEVDGRPVARYMLYRTDVTKDEWPSYGYVKGESYVYCDQVHTEMKRLGKKLAYGTPTVCRFEVPALFHPLLKDGKVAHCPLPFSDEHQKDFSVVYDEEKQVFVFDKSTKLKGTAVPNMYHYRGYIDSSVIVRINKKEEEKKEPEAAKEVLMGSAKSRTCRTCSRLKSEHCKTCSTIKDAGYHDKWEKAPEGKVMAAIKKVIMGGAAEVKLPDAQKVNVEAVPADEWLQTLE